MTELMLAVTNTIQLVALAYLAYRQAEVKRDLNGSSDKLAQELLDLREELAAIFPPPAPPRGLTGP